MLLMNPDPAATTYSQYQTSPPARPSTARQSASLLAANPGSQQTEDAVRQFMFEVCCYHAVFHGEGGMLIGVTGLRELGEVPPEPFLPGQPGGDEPYFQESGGSGGEEVSMSTWLMGGEVNHEMTCHHVLLPNGQILMLMSAPPRHSDSAVRDSAMLWPARWHPDPAPHWLTARLPVCCRVRKHAGTAVTRSNIRLPLQVSRGAGRGLETSIYISAASDQRKREACSKDGSTNLVRRYLN